MFILLHLKYCLHRPRLKKKKNIKILLQRNKTPESDGIQTLFFHNGMYTFYFLRCMRKCKEQSERGFFAKRSDEKLVLLLTLKHLLKPEVDPKLTFPSPQAINDK